MHINKSHPPYPEKRDRDEISEVGGVKNSKGH